MMKFHSGQITPDFLLPAVENSAPATFYEQYCGESTLLLFAPEAGMLSRYKRLSTRTQLLGFVSGAETASSRSDPWILHEDGRLTQAFLGCRKVPELIALLLRPTLTIQAKLHQPSIMEIEKLLDAMPEQTLSVCAETAPVLMVPEVLPHSLCEALIAAHEADHFDSGMMRMDDNKLVLVPDPSSKKRQDHLLNDPALAAAVSNAISERLLPAISRAFHYPVTRMEGYKVVCYDGATGGYFRLHRDNITPDAQHRRFALSLNLNQDYSGGELMFPEFGATRYRPPAGGALVFSGTLLHAATDVTQGKRYALLTFMWGNEPN
jgi:predicted 2-oxoglutarate/Fe(II)-dependent dioxygenase YbiX